MKTFFLLLSLLSVLSVAAQNHQHGLHLQIANELIEFNRFNVEYATMFETSSNHAGILIRIKSFAAKKLENITQKAIGQTALWIWEGKVVTINKIQAPFSDSVTVLNLTKIDAEQFVKSIR